MKATITGVGAYAPEDILTNDELSQMVDTTDEWIMTRIGIKERHILKGEGLGSSYMGVQAVNELLRKTNTSPDEVEALICATVTPDHVFPATANIISDKAGIKNAFSFDINAGCSGFLYALETGSKLITSGQYKKIVIVGADKMSSITDYTDRTTCPIFGDAAGAVMLEPTEDGTGIQDSILLSDGAGKKHLHQKAGGSAKPPTPDTVANREHFIYQEGQHVFKWAVTKMADVSVEMMNRHNISAGELDWLVPHQANMRIIEATARRMGIKREQVMINIQRYGNTTAATLPLCLYEWEKELKPGNNIILATFGAGFTWGSMYIKWSYNGNGSQLPSSK